MTPEEIRKLTEMTRFLAEIRRLQNTLKEVNRIQRLRNLLKWLYQNRANLEALKPEDRRSIRETLDEEDAWKRGSPEKTFPFYNQILQTPFQSWKEFLKNEMGLSAERASYDAEEWEILLRRLMED